MKGANMFYYELDNGEAGENIAAELCKHFFCLVYFFIELVYCL